jgi:hypothetical protein
VRSEHVFEKHVLKVQDTDTIGLRTRQQEGGGGNPTALFSSVQGITGVGSIFAFPRFAAARNACGDHVALHRLVKP